VFCNLHNSLTVQRDTAAAAAAAANVLLLLLRYNHGHRSPTELFGGPQRFSPPEMLARYMADPKYTQAGIANTTVQVRSQMPADATQISCLLN